MPNEVTQGVSNYLVPATGSPNAYVIKDKFTASPQSVNFQNIQLNGLAFRPSGVIIDNTKSASPLVVLIPEMSFNISCPAGASLNMPYPAPMNHTASITGAGDAEATVIFVDYPLQPYSSAQAAGSPPIPNPLPVSVPNPLPVSGPVTDAEMRATPIIVIQNKVAVSFFEYTTINGIFTLPSGLAFAEITNIGAAAGTVMTVPLAAGTKITFNFGSNNMSNIALPMDATGTTFAVTYIQY